MGGRSYHHGEFPQGATGGLLGVLGDPARCIPRPASSLHHQPAGRRTPPAATSTLAAHSSPRRTYGPSAALTPGPLADADLPARHAVVMVSVAPAGVGGLAGWREAGVLTLACPHTPPGILRRLLEHPGAPPAPGVATAGGASFAFLASFAVE